MFLTRLGFNSKMIVNGDISQIDLPNKVKSGLIDGKEIQNILQHPQDFIESQEYFSWERFFTSILIQYTEKTYLKYHKRSLNQVYLHDKMKQAILDVMEKITFEQ